MTKRCVIKVGGSLFNRKDFPLQMVTLLETEYADQQVNLVFGGGGIIDALRAIDAGHTMNPRDMHWRCTRALGLTFELACEWFPLATRIETQAAFDSHCQCRLPGHYLIAIDSFYSFDDAASLPQDWTTTSDSISALLATKLGIEQLALVKSCAEHQLTLDAAADAGIIDPVFPEASRHLAVAWHFL